MVVRLTYHFIFLTAACFGLSFSTYGLEVSASIDKNPVMIDEALILTVTATGDVNRNAFNSSVLLKDFIVENTSVSSQTRIVNFDSTQTTTWQTRLFPKKEGRFTIPPISIEGEQTQPINVHVIPVPTSTTQEQRDYFVTAELAQSSVFVQEHLKYTVKLHMAQSIERGSLQAPVMEDAIVEQVGEDEQYSDIINGKRFQVIERNYVIIPEKSGNFVVQGPIFSGEVLASNSRSTFNMFSRTRPITRRGPSLNLTVKAIPAQYSGAWLPSEYVDLKEEWSNDENFVVGEPITRTLTLTVAGQKKEQLPLIEQRYPPYVKHYADQPNTASAQKDGVIISQRTESTAIIPSEPGTLVIPGAQVTWFNTRTQTVETASIPAKSYTVAPALTNERQQQIETLDTPQPVTTDNPPSIQSTTKGSSKVWIILTIVMSIAWAISTALLLSTRRKLKRVLTSHSINPAPIKPGAIDVKTLLSTLKTNDVSKIQSQLLTWLSQVDQTAYANLADAFRSTNNKAIQASLSVAFQGLYGKSRIKPDFTALSESIKNKASEQEKRFKSNKTHLPALYPS